MLSVRTRLCVMMFLEFFIWGAWFPLSFTYLPSLGFTSWEQSIVLNAFAVASIAAIFFSNQFADRLFAAEKFVAFSHLVGGIAIMGLTWVTDFWPFLGLLLLHSLFYVPTISITNSIAFTHMKDSRDFGFVRLWGTIGWIVAGLPFIFILADWANISGFGSVSFTDWCGEVLGKSLKGPELMNTKRYIFFVAGLGSLALAAFSLVLPHTPPTPAKASGEKLAWLEAIRLLRQPFLAILLLVTFIDATVHQCYFGLTAGFFEDRVHIPGNWVMPAMSIGQFAEIGTMAILGFVLKHLGWRTTMVLGVLGHTVRFATFALAPEPLPALTVNVLHGVCYAFFFATVYIFVDEFFPKDTRASAQGLFNLMILGLGPSAGFFLAPALRDHVFKTDGVTDYRNLFLCLSGLAAVAAGILIVGFHPPKAAAEVAG